MAVDEPSPDVVRRVAEQLRRQSSASASPPLDRALAVDAARLARAGVIVPGAGRTRLSEEFRIIKQRLLHRADTLPRGGIVLVTSCRSGEGKTFVAVNLALSLASERDRRAILVDADLYAHAAMEPFGVAGQPGLIDLLLDEQAHTADFLLDTSIPHLSLLPAGRTHTSATELFTSQRMAAVLAELHQTHPDAVIVLDAPPVLAGTEPAALAAHVGQVILVTEYNHTPKRIVERALSLIAACANIAFVINKIDAAIDGPEMGRAYRYDVSGVDG
jgi:exopolysaccharide/PEP-CTERM locus tyrosine autokinase